MYILKRKWFILFLLALFHLFFVENARRCYTSTVLFASNMQKIATHKFANHLRLSIIATILLNGQFVYFWACRPLAITTFLKGSTRLASGRRVVRYNCRRTITAAPAIPLPPLMQKSR
jgi:hypothetical protein